MKTVLNESSLDFNFDSKSNKEKEKICNCTDNDFCENQLTFFGGCLKCKERLTNKQ